MFLYNMSILIGYKMYTVTDNLFNFAVKGNLPSNWVRRRNKCIMISLYVFSIATVVAYIFMNTYYTFVDRNMNILREFKFYNKFLDISQMVFIAVLYFLSYAMIKKTLKFTLVNRR